MNKSKMLTFFTVAILSLTSCGPSKRYEAIKATQEKIVNNKDYEPDYGTLSLIFDYDQKEGTLVETYLQTKNIEEDDRFDLFIVFKVDGGIQRKVDLLFYDNAAKNVEGYMQIYASSISSTYIYANDFTIKDSYTLGSREYTLIWETNDYPNELASSTAYKLLDSMLELGISAFSHFCTMNALYTSAFKVFFPSAA